MLYGYLLKSHRFSCIINLKLHRHKEGLLTGISNESAPQIVTFTLGDMMFEYDEVKNQKNIAKHGISFSTAARVFFDYDRIEYYDKENSYEEDRYDTIGDTSAGAINLESVNCESSIARNIKQSIGMINDILFVVYTERVTIDPAGKKVDVTRLISARLATNFERGIYYGKHE